MVLHRKTSAALRAVNGWLWLLLLAGLVVFIIKCRIVYPIEYVGHADASGYAEMADSLVHGRGLEVDYVSFHFIKYSPEISRPEDHWPPLYSFLIAPFFLILGKTAFAAKLPSLIISSFFLPALGYLLAKRFSDSDVTGFATGAHLLIYPAFFEHSLFCLSDVTFAFMVSLTVLLAVKGFDNPRYFYAMGVAMGLAYYAKGAGLILLPAYGLFYLIRRTQQTDRPFLIGIGLALLTLAPWFIRNQIHFGSPMFSTQQFAAGYIGYIPWEQGTYPLYWGENLPSFSTKVARWGISHIAEKTEEFFKQHLWWAFIDINGSPERFEREQFAAYLTGIPAAIGLALMVVSSIAHLSSIREHMPAIALKGLRPWHNPNLHVVWLVPLFLFSFLSLCWQPINRLAFPATPLVIATGWTTYHIMGRQLLGWLKYRRIIVGALIFALLIPLTRHCIESIQERQQRGGYPFHDDDREWIEAGKWIKENLPGSVTMTRNPWELHFYSEQKAVQIPLSELGGIIEVAKYYGATHLIPDENRPSLEKWISGEIPGLELVYNRELKIYKIDYERLPSSLLSH